MRDGCLIVVFIVIFHHFIKLNDENLLMDDGSQKNT